MRGGGSKGAPGLCRGGGETWDSQRGCVSASSRSQPRKGFSTAGLLRCVPRVAVKPAPGLWPTRLRGAWGFPGESTGVGSSLLLRGWARSPALKTDALPSELQGSLLCPEVRCKQANGSLGHSRASSSPAPFHEAQAPAERGCLRRLGLLASCRAAPPVSAALPDSPVGRGCSRGPGFRVGQGRPERCAGSLLHTTVTSSSFSCAMAEPRCHTFQSSKLKWAKIPSTGLSPQSTPQLWLGFRRACESHDPYVSLMTLTSHSLLSSPLRILLSQPDWIIKDSHYPILFSLPQTPLLTEFPALSLHFG